MSDGAASQLTLSEENISGAKLIEPLESHNIPRCVGGYSAGVFVLHPPSRKLNLMNGMLSMAKMHNCATMTVLMPIMYAESVK